MAVRFLLLGACLLPMLAGCQGLALVNREPWAAAPVLRAQGIDEPLPEAGEDDDTPRMPLREFPALPSPSRPKMADRKLSLQEAVTLALQDSDVVRTLSGGSVDAGGVTRFDPAVLEAQALAASAIFAPRLSYGYVGSRINEPPSYYYGPGIPAQTRRDEGNFYASLSKPLPTGGTAGISYAPPLGYLFFPNGTSGLFNPAYTSALVFDFRQPLLRGAGYVVNTAPIRIAQLRTEQSTWRVKAALMSEVRSIEEAYWNLQATYVGLQSIELMLPLLEEVVRS